MKLLVEFSHPAQVHKFKNALQRLNSTGIEVLILSRDKDVMLPLLHQLALRHKCISRARSGILGSMIELLIREVRTLWEILRFKPDLLLSAHSVAITHMGWLLRIPRIVHEDTEFGKVQQRLYMPFANRILTSSAYYLDWGPRQVRVPSLEPLAYLHPNYFRADASRLDRYGLDTGTRYAVIRIVAWKAMHDRGLDGQITKKLNEIAEMLRGNGFSQIVLSTEEIPGQVCPSDFIRPSVLDLHHLLAFAELCLSESITVAGEAAVLGTPALLINPLRAGHSLELERYGLLERCEDIDQLLKRAGEMSSDKNISQQWSTKRSRLLQEKSDMTEAIVDFIQASFEL